MFRVSRGGKVPHILAPRYWMEALYMYNGKRLPLPSFLKNVYTIH